MSGLGARLKSVKRVLAGEKPVKENEYCVLRITYRVDKILGVQFTQYAVGNTLVITL